MGAGARGRDGDREFRGRGRQEDERRGSGNPRRPGGRRGVRDDSRGGASRDARGRGGGGREEERVAPPGLERRADEPAVPEGLDERLLPRAVSAELRGLSKETAEAVTGHLIAAGELIDIDPELAHRHALAARRRASRLPVVREAAAETSYAVGDYAGALNEYRALRRMTGSDEYWAVMADCERGLGRPDDALRLIGEARQRRLSPEAWAEVLLVESGLRRDQGQAAEADRLLKAGLAKRGLPAECLARLAYAYADARSDSDSELAIEWFAQAAEWDRDGLTDAADRADALRGMVVELGDEDGDE